MSLPPKPSQGHINWTDGNVSKVADPGSPKKLLGWVVNEKPAFEWMNWLFWTVDQWQDYFEAVTDQNLANITTLQGQVTALGNASSISATHTGHVKLTGNNVQVQLDQADAALKDLYDAVTSGLGIDLVGYDPAAPANWTPAPSNAGAGLDQLASRVKTLEASSAGNDYIAQSFSDFVISATKPVTGFPTGYGNTGFTDNNNTNPRGIKLSSLQTKWGEERIYFNAIKQTGKYDANGLVEWAVYCEREDIRIRLYGDWRHDYNGATYDAEVYLDGRMVQTNKPGDYMLVTGVFDSLALGCNVYPTNSDAIAMTIDGTSAGTLSIRGSSIFTVNAQQTNEIIIGDPGITNIGYGLHTIKFMNAATDASTTMPLNMVSLITTGQKELGGSMYLNKLLLTLPNQAITPASLGGKGGKLIRYVDSADSTRKDAAQSVLEVNNTVTGSVGSGTTSLGLNSSAVGLVAPCIVEISDGPTNMELIYVTAVNTFTNILTLQAPGTVNTYTNPTVKLHAKVLSAVTHANEKNKYDRPIGAYSQYISSLQSGLDVNYLISGSVSNMQGRTQDGVWSYQGSEGTFFEPFGGGTRFYTLMRLNSSTNYIYLIFKGTGIDLFIEPYTLSSGTSAFRYTVDGVDLPNQTYSFGPNAVPFWTKIASDLPEGTHVLKIYAIDSNCSLFGFLSTKMYEAADPSATALVPVGDLLSRRTKLADYLYNPNVFAPSKGVIASHIWNNLYPGNTNASATSFGINSATNGNDSTLARLFAVEVDSSTTNDVLRKWFYGTGIELLQYLDTDRGITEYKIDGLLATAANFPGMTFQGGGSNYNTTTGLFDSYNSAGALTKKLSFSGLAEGWHELQWRCTGTKNVSSSSVNTMIFGMFIIGAAYSDDVFTTGKALTTSVHLNGAHDLRMRDSYNEEEQDRLVDLGNNFNQINFGVITNNNVGVRGAVALVETHGGDLEILFQCTTGSSGGGVTRYLLLLIDAIVYTFTSGYANAAGATTLETANVRIPLPAGRHHILGAQQMNGGAQQINEGFISIREIPLKKGR